MLPLSFIRQVFPTHPPHPKPWAAAMGNTDTDPQPREAYVLGGKTDMKQEKQEKRQYVRSL